MESTPETDAVCAVKEKERNEALVKLQVDTAAASNDKHYTKSNSSVVLAEVRIHAEGRAVCMCVWGV